MLGTGKTEVLILRRWTVRLAVLVTLFLVLAGGWLLYTWGGAHSREALTRLRLERDDLQARVAVLEERNSELQRQFAAAERARQIDQQAYADYRRSRAQLEQTITALREELAFYRGIMAPEREIEGVHAQDFSLAPGLGPRSFRFRLVMVQIGSNDHLAQGEIELSVRGIQDGAATAYDHASLSPDPEAAAAIRYRYRYFQVIEGNWILPAGFTAREVEVRAQPRGGGEVQHWSFAWTTAAGMSATEENANVGE
ncbi:MAG TPA: DUF6776 family protein [Thiohalobacter sp.]|nr:DUF6776 family protein [Thiohalobacter sp.]